MTTTEHDFVSHNFTCDTDTRELGEASAMIAQVARHLQLAEQYLEWLRASPHAGVKKSAQIMFEYLGDARADSSWNALVEEAKEASETAMVRKVARTFAPEVKS